MTNLQTSAAAAPATGPLAIPGKMLARVRRLPTSGQIGVLILLFIVLTATFAPLLAPQDPVAQSLINRNKGFSAEHWFGTDAFGRDVFSRLIVGTRHTIFLASLSLMASAALGILIGLIAAYNRGKWTDSLICWSMDILLTFPMVILGVVVVAILGQGTMNVGIAIAVAFLPRMVRMSRGVALTLVTSEFVEAARSIGASPTRIVLRHLLPNVMIEMSSISTLWLATAIKTETSLSFLGLGVQPPTPSWGLMVREGLSTLYINPWPSMLPVIAIFITIIGLNLVVDGTQDSLNPHTKDI
ncbi:ABC transporter permease [Hoeflea ulvae]|uniref:ABC transporter permease n=1 Tax=Hoeflea ulvae TaxID=2983764 RepID=A0ABT3YD14_9HYPH|nr:ABC transporter permease [Hoeflea ulvae]MCY0093753.1 ABC transporter permease [Hoeflea ulvae]